MLSLLFVSLVCAPIALLVEGEVLSTLILKASFLLIQIDLTEALESFAPQDITTDDPEEVKPVWRDASFSLKYYSDALFDFPKWFGFSKRTFKASYLLFSFHVCNHLHFFPFVSRHLANMLSPLSLIIKAETNVSQLRMKRREKLYLLGFRGVCHCFLKETGKRTCLFDGYFVVEALKPKGTAGNQ